MKTTNKINMSAFFVRGILTGTAMATVILVNTAVANPTGGSVVAGSAVIVPTAPKVLDINQSTNKAIINWSAFNIAPDETTNFNQPGASSVTLNRIGSANPSQILGSLNANGQLMLVNPNGVFFGKQAKVDTASLMATTADINNADFMSGKYAFSKAGKPNGQVVNNGTIKVDDGGYVALAAPTATNNGTITANLGKVAIAGTDVFTLDPVGDKLINFSLPNGVVRSGPLGNAASAANHGTIYADQGKVQLTAKAAKATLDSLVNMDGVIQAQSSKYKKGSVYLGGDNVDVSGEIDVSGIDKASGGKIEAIGKKYLAFTGDANAEGGPNGGNGGSILMQGDTLALGGTASVGAPNGDGGVATFKAGDTFDIYSSEAYTIGDAVSHGGTVNVLANDTINLESGIDGTQSAMLQKNGGQHGHDGHNGGYPDVLNFGDGDNNGDLTINLNAKIVVPPTTALIGDGTQVNVSDEGSIQNGVDVASTAGADVAVGPGTYDENVNVYKNDINLHSAPGGFMTVAYDENAKGGHGGGYGGHDDDNDGYDNKPVIEGYVNVTADNDTVDGFKILGGSLNGETVGVNVNGGSNAQILNNHIALGDTNSGESDVALLDKNGHGGGQGGGYGGQGQGTGIKLTDAPDALVKKNTITGANTGIALNDSDRTTVESNKVHADKTGIDVYDSSNVKVKGNEISGNAWDDGHHHGHDNLAAKNGHGGYGNGGTVGINANKAANIKIDGNTVKNEDTAIKLKDSANAKVTWNTASNVTNGTVGDNADNLVYDQNKVTGRSNYQGDGLMLKDSSNAKVTNNKHNNVKNKLRLVNSNTTVKTGNNF